MSDTLFPQPSHGDLDRQEEIVRYVHDVLTSPAMEEEFPDHLGDVPNMRQLHTTLWAVRKLSHALSNGDLDVSCREGGFVVGALKDFQANLRRLTWQAQRIASGEFDHRVNFLGEFAVAFNQMAEQLGTTMSSLRQLNEEYKDLSHKDPLTGLYNRHAFMKFAENLLVHERRADREAALIMADIDKFKDVNDTYGHLCGDEVLRRFSKCLMAGLRNRDLCARYGGEEFIILMPNTHLDAGVKIAERMRKAIEAMTVPFEEHMIHVTASFGLSRVDGIGDGETFEDYINSHIHVADLNLYMAKDAGRNRVVATLAAPEEHAGSPLPNACVKP